MMKKNGFVFMETVVVVCVLSLTLLMLYGSYSHILRNSRQKKTFDTTDSIYTTYYVKKLIAKHKSSASYESYFNTNCTRLTGTGGPVYVCDVEAKKTDPNWSQLRNVFEVDKIYYLRPSRLLGDSTLLLKLDATTIDYIRSLGVGVTQDIIIVKYKHVHEDGTYEVIHSSIEGV